MVKRRGISDFEKAHGGVDKENNVCGCSIPDLERVEDFHGRRGVKYCKKCNRVWCAWGKELGDK